MRNKIKIVSIVISRSAFSVALLISVFFLFVSSEKQKTEWKGTIKEVGGVTVVKNPDEPFFGELILDLEEDLIIGNEEDENHMFYRAWNIAVDSKENILILDSGNYRIQKFSRKGEYLITIGKKGEGPGEFSNPTNLFIDSNDNIYVYDSRRIKVFNENCQYQRDIILKNHINNFAINLKNEIFAIMFHKTESGEFNSFIKLDDEGKLLKIIEEFPPAYRQVVKKSGERTIGFRIDHPYSISSYLSAGDNKNFVCGQSLEYKLYVVNAEGDLILRIEKDDPYLPITKKEKDRIKSGFTYLEKKWPKNVIEEAIQFPSHRPFFEGTTVDDKGRIWVMKINSILDKRNEREFDIFSKDGFFLCKTKLSISPKVIKNGYIYNLERDKETKGLRIKKFKVNNWTQIKESI